MMKERLDLLMQEAREQFATLPNRDDYCRISTVVYFSPCGDHLPVHLLVDIAALKDVDFEECSEETDLFSFYEGEILGELSDEYLEIKSFLWEFAQAHSNEISFFLSEPLLKSLPYTRRRYLTMEDILFLLEKACQTGDFSLWNTDRPKVDIEVGFRLDEEIS